MATIEGNNEQVPQKISQFILTEYLYMCSDN